MIREIMRLTQKPLLTPQQVATRLAKSKRNILDMFRSGELRGVKVGKEWRMDSDELERYIQIRKTRQK